MENTETEKQLALATAHWLEYMSLSGYRRLFSEASLIIPVAEYFRGQQWKVAAEVDCYKLLKMKWRKGLAGYVNYDVHAERSKGVNSDQVILEMKFMKGEISGKEKDEISGEEEDAHAKRATPNYSRLISDFIKLAIPDKDRNWKRLSLVARAATTASLPSWLPSSEGDEPLKLKIKTAKLGEKDETVAIDRIGATEIEPLDASVGESSILSKLRAYEIIDLGLEVKYVHSVQMNSIQVFVFSVQTDRVAGAN
jgi:hypothetical protein